MANGGTTIEIANLSINTSALIKSTAETKKNLDDLKESQKQLSKTIKEGGADAQEAGEQYIKNAVEMNALSKSYRDSIKAIEAQNQSLSDNEEATKLVVLAQNKEISSVNEARANVALLTRVRNETNTSTEEGKARILELNKALDANNEYIEENADAYLKLKLNIGNYSDSIKEAFDNVNIFNGGIGGFVSRSQEAGGAGNLLATSFNGITAGLKGMVLAGLAFIATPIGIVITALAVAVGVIVGAFKLMVSGMKSTEEGSNKLSVMMAKFSGVINMLGKVLKPVAEFLFNVFSNTLNGILLIGEKLIETFVKVARALGLDSIADGVEGVTNAIKENVRQAEDLANAENKLNASRRTARLIQLQYQKDAEKLRQIRDDESKSIAERTKANADLGALLKKQANEELEIAKQALRVADLRLIAEGKSTENLDARAEALTEIADIQERITGQESEQLANLNSLRKESADKEKERREKALADQLAKSQALLELYRSEQGFKKKSNEDLMKDAERVHQFNLKIAQDEFNASAKTEADKLKLKTANNEANIELAKTLADIAISEGQRELDIYRENIQLRIDEGKFLTDAVLAEKLREQSELVRLEEEYQAIRLANGAINEQEYNDAINTIRLEDQLKRAELDEEKKIADEERKLIDLENRRIAEADIFNADLEIQAEQNAIRLAQELEQAEKNGADKDIIKAKYAKIESDRQKAVEENKVVLAETALGAIGGLLKEQSLLGKAFAMFQIGIDTQQAIMKALSSAPPPLSYVLAGAVGIKGAMSLAKVAGAKFEKGGIQEVGGRRHSGGGTKFYGDDGTTLEAEKGEGIGVLSRSAFSQFKSFNDAFTGSSGSTFSGSGSGVLSQTLNGSNNSSSVADSIASVMDNLPPIVVSVEDINYGLDKSAKIMSNGDIL